MALPVYTIAHTASTKEVPAMHNAAARSRVNRAVDLAHQSRDEKIAHMAALIKDMADSDALEEEYIDDLLSIVQQYHALLTQRRKWLSE